MPRENSFSDSDGRSLTPDLSEEAANGGAPPMSPTYAVRPPFVAEPTTQEQAHSHDLHVSSSKHSIHSRKTTHSRRTMQPADRFRGAVRKVIAMHRGTSLIATRGRVGAEPGVDPRRASADVQYGSIRQNCVIEVFDYSSVRHSFGRMTNKEFVNFLDDADASKPEPWVKVRWINIGGMSWDVIKAVSLKYDLHPLALEDVFHTRSQTRSKADYYSKHLFLRILVHEIGDPDDIPTPLHATAAYGSTLTGLPRTSSPVPFKDVDSIEMKDSVFVEDDRTVFGEITPMPAMRKRKGRSSADPEKGGSTFRRLGRIAILDADEEALKQQAEEEVALQALKKEGDRVNVKVYPLHIFLFRDGTVISMHGNPSLDLTQPIANRLNQRDTGLRASADPSLLVQSLLDLTVDKALEVIDVYHAKIQKFERAILYKPKIKTVRNLHLLNEDLILHKRTMEPIRTVVYGLRRYDVDRCAALIDESKSAVDGKVQVVGFMSHKSKIYLADVYDHVEYILSSLDMFAGITQNLIDYTFNMTSYEMNEIMRRLTIATIICLPLTLLTGYFGMNFESMWSVKIHSDVLFWEIAIPVMCLVIPLAIWPDLMRMVHYVKKKMLTRKAVKMYRRR
ncbi:magnesium transporter [Guyanagaster necrorhizus]|uniref:Magnesium transporter n=1 Tax=Guyanagaster necrorhizus TaxID=856835 RepID=A0A9P7W3P9_9AGAR|nr:magnesium transporter [Guyanagaster necrorhizus MCA 3950]KAG7452072.1 magnesium transporter [Guyanagaster necrorhizus MCA 3950]